MCVQRLIDIQRWHFAFQRVQHHRTFLGRHWLVYKPFVLWNRQNNQKPTWKAAQDGSCIHPQYPFHTIRLQSEKDGYCRVSHRKCNTYTGKEWGMVHNRLGQRPYYYPFALPINRWRNNRIRPPTSEDRNQFALYGRANSVAQHPFAHRR